MLLILKRNCHRDACIGAGSRAAQELLSRQEAISCKRYGRLREIATLRSQ